MPVRVRIGEGAQVFGYALYTCVCVCWDGMLYGVCIGRRWAVFEGGGRSRAELDERGVGGQTARRRTTCR